MSEPVHRGVSLPTFCSWRALSGVLLVSILSTVLVLFGQLKLPQVRDALLMLVYGLGLGLTSAIALCVTRAWLRRLTQRMAWLGAWVVVLVNTLVVSYCCAIVGGVLGAGLSPGELWPFMLSSVLAVGIVSAALLRYLFIRGLWRAQTEAQAEARVQALQSRIRPHFLFNSLNTIASLIPDDPDGAERATLDLADLFRGSMRRVDQLIPMSEELALARKYIEIEQRRLGDRLSVEWEVDALPAEAQVLPMILQPLLENAVGHGIQPRAEGGDLKLFGRLEGDTVVITVSNPLPEVPTPGGQGHALRNIGDRLRLSFGAAGSLVTSSDDERYYAVLTLPYAETADR